MVLLLVRKNKKLLTTAKYVFPLLLLVFAIIEIKKFIAGIDIQLFQHEINQLHFGTLSLIFTDYIYCGSADVAL